MYFKRIGEEKVKKLIDDKTHLNLSNLKHEFVHLKSFDKYDPCLNLLTDTMPLFENLTESDDGAILIFCNSVPSVHGLEHFLNENGLKCVSLHSEVPKKLRL